MSEKIKKIDNNKSKKLKNVFNETKRIVENERHKNSNQFVSYPLDWENGEWTLQISYGIGILDGPSLFEDLIGTGGFTLKNNDKKGKFQYVPDNRIRNINIKIIRSDSSSLSSKVDNSFYIFEKSGKWIPYAMSFSKPHVMTGIYKRGYVTLEKGNETLKDWSTFSSEFNEIKKENLEKEQKEVKEDVESYIEYIDENIGMEKIESFYKDKSQTI
ncbi:hypothetical protein GGP72_000281 [Salinibacter ruber]|uniref:Uncharacterized protein n=1 Tax=Salinibacter ruber TaxID=146919 RepID=A0A9X2PT99_9BACT|nr:hypothetical protein [Salinibacter ruber]MCS3676385.1 hypothetical protein [Salinibacter ruber]MCS3679672.1 hypothetical protein [Salinibacter ruber]